MSEVKKFSEDELKGLAGLQQQYQSKIFELGKVKLDEIKAKAAVEQIMKDWDTISKADEAQMKVLSEKYGSGTLNVKDGTFTPNEEDKPIVGTLPTLTPTEIVAPSAATAGLVQPHVENADVVV
jgi:hypothetical protein